MKKKYQILLIAVFILALALIYWPRRWQYIVIHHSAGKFGNIEHLQKVHSERQPNDPIDAIAYHYIIGNGHGLEDGAIDSDLRKRYNLWGVHVRSVNFDKNFLGIGICVVGNLDKDEITDKQFASLVELTKELMANHGIKEEHVLFHGEIEQEQTACPGKHFPKKRFLEALQLK